MAGIKTNRVAICIRAPTGRRWPGKGRTRPALTNPGGPQRSPPSTADTPTVSLLILRHAGNEITLDDSQGPFSLGRENVCGLVATGHKVSRLHAAIEFKGNRFLLIDRSTNGTFVKFGKEPEIRLHRQELALRGKGLIGLAGSTYDPNVDVVAFELTTAS